MFAPAAARAAGLLALTAASLASLFAQVTNPRRAAFYESNKAMTLHVRHLHVGAVIAVGAVTLAVCAGLLLWRRDRANVWVERAARLSAPLSLAGLLPALYAPSFADPARVSIYLAALVLLLERLLRGSVTEVESLQSTSIERFRSGLRSVFEARPKLVRALPWAVVLGATAFYVAFMCVMTLRAHARFQTFGYDLGQFTSLFANTLAGRFMRNPPLGFFTNWEELRNHAHLSVFVFLPFYALHPSATTLLVIQSVLLGSSAIAIFLFARRRLPAVAAVTVSLAYLAYPPLHAMNMYDVHMQPVASVFILWAICSLDARRYTLYWVLVVFALSCREDIPIGLTVLGIWLALSGKHTRTGVATAAIAGTYFVLIRFVIMPSFGTWYFADHYHAITPAKDRSFGGVIKTMLSNPGFVAASLLTWEKLRYAFQVLAPIAFLPLRRAWLLPSLVAWAMLTLLTTDLPAAIDIAFQYTAHFIAYGFPAACLALASLRTSDGGTSKQRAATATLAFASVSACILWGAFSPRPIIRAGNEDMAFTAPTDAHRKKAKDLAELAAKVPPDDRVGVTEPELPHVASTHLNVTSLRDGLYDAPWLLYDQAAHGHDVGDEAQRQGLYEVVELRSPLKLLRRVKPAP